jgi:hypothetical protein
VLPALAWLQSLDRVCSLAGICDGNFIDGGMLNLPLRQVDPSAVDLTELHTPWDDFIEPEAVTVWLGSDPRLQVVNPWNNVSPMPAQQ